MLAPVPDEGGIGAQSKLWDLLLQGQESPPGQVVLPLTMQVALFYLCCPWDHAWRKAQLPRPAHSLPGRPPASARGTSLGAERELEPGSNSWPHSSIPQGPLPLFPGPHPSRSQAAPHPQNTQARGGCEGPPAGKSHLPTGYQAQAGGGPAWPLTHSSAYVHRLSLPVGYTHSRQWKAPGRPLQPEGITCKEANPQQLWNSCTQICVEQKCQFGGCHPSWQHQWDTCLLAFLGTGLGEFWAVSTDPVLLFSNPPHPVHSLGCQFLSVAEAVNTCVPALPSRETLAEPSPTCSPALQRIPGRATLGVLASQKGVTVLLVGCL